MKKRIFFIITIIAAYVIVVLSGSAKKEIPVNKAMAAFCQTWINPDYHPGLLQQKKVVTSDGNIKWYKKVDSPLKWSSLRQTFTIDDAWTDRDGNIWFMTTDKGGYHLNATSYSLNKISKSGSVWESVWSVGELPDDIDPDSDKYTVYNRQ